MPVQPDAYFRVIPGRFVIVGYEPDGDSVRFIADDATLFDGLRGSHRARYSRDGSLQLRYEGIDAPELHYAGAEQPLGAEARDKLLGLIGFTGVQVTGAKVTVADQVSIAGYILTKAFEGHGRPIAYAYVGAPAVAPGTSLYVDDAILDQSLNAEMLRNGAAYPLLYTSGPSTHRARFRSLAAAARAAAAAGSVWAADSTSDFKLVDGDSIVAPDGVVIFPKLFRRAIDYLKADPGVDLGDWLRNNGRENDEVIIDGTTHVEFSSLIRQTQNHVGLQGDLLDYVFVEK